MHSEKEKVDTSCFQGQQYQDSSFIPGAQPWYLCFLSWKGSMVQSGALFLERKPPLLVF